MKILVTGVAGFIGAATAKALLARGEEVVGVDNISPYYDTKLKEARLELLRKNPKFRFQKVDISDREATASYFKEFKPERVVHLAAQAGVRYSITNPHAYVDANLVGFVNILEGCRHNGVQHLVFASSSSVYGANKKLPFSVGDVVDHPVSLYAATKLANELLAHSYSHLYGLPATGLRFFTVYGPWGRPDMALFIFTKNILEGKPIELFNEGKHRRDFTYIDDIVEGVVRVLDRPASPDETTTAPYRLYNIGNHNPVWLNDMLNVLQEALGKKAQTKLVRMQPGDVVETFADVEALARDFDFRPKTPIETGIKNFVEWYRSFYQV